MKVMSVLRVLFPSGRALRHGPPLSTTRAALRRFESRFRAMERDLARPFTACTLDEMMSAWRRAKAAE